VGRHDQGGASRPLLAPPFDRARWDEFVRSTRLSAEG